MFEKQNNKDFSPILKYYSKCHRYSRNGNVGITHKKAVDRKELNVRETDQSIEIFHGSTHTHIKRSHEQIKKIAHRTIYSTTNSIY